MVCVIQQREPSGQPWESFRRKRRRDNRWAPGRLPVGERRTSDMPLCWGRKDALKPPGHWPNVRQSVHMLGICSGLYWSLSPVYVCMCVFLHRLGRWLTTGKRAEQSSTDRWGRSASVGVFVCLAEWVQEMAVNICTIEHIACCVSTPTNTYKPTHPYAHICTHSHTMFTAPWQTLFMYSPYSSHLWSVPLNHLLYFHPTK